ncbi:hypothetical protein AKJ65_08225 [candidate division MSBL1 archaeon SCGC-AAA259E19]|uniref:SUF system FeS cluster assembly SufBD core domain-containing protein n=1 Tax=candidate division MSBL1 archaeon SCGC-AAA259E19 TaxID=1698264 RepID=A0A133UCQ2_9EURY|nr:hypothetical protein AKJ65_08225 [candidate division MSBL1 archaeon SCGC-AAA259E19]
MQFEDFYELAGIESPISDPDTAHLSVDRNQIVSSNDLPGLTIDAEPTENGIDLSVIAEEGRVFENPVHFCFGVTPSEGKQIINIDPIEIREGAKISALAHCLFPRAKDVEHVMEADVRLGKGASFGYFEKHIHSPTGGTRVVPKGKYHLGENSKLRTDFELLQGRAGELGIDYRMTGEKNSELDATVRVDSSGHDRVDVKENADLVGKGATGVIKTRIAARENAEAYVTNKLVGAAPNARGHVDCKEIADDEGNAGATPIVRVKHPQAHVTHEAAIGSVNKKELETLLSKGLSEEKATGMIVNSLLASEEDEGIPSPDEL